MPAESAVDLTVMAVGDVLFDVDGADWYLEPSVEVLSSGDVVIAHVEAPFTKAAPEDFPVALFPQAAGDPAELAALKRAGVNVATTAGNHAYDYGVQGVVDTLGALRELGIVVAGTGVNIDEARKPALLEANGRRIGVLSYNAVGLEESWARPHKAGCAYVEVLTHYVLDHANPAGVPKAYAFCEPDSLEQMSGDIRRLAAEVDVVFVSLHKGAVGRDAPLPYEIQLSHAAIDAGAHAVFGHHAHYPYGIEIYEGRPVFHGLGNFLTITGAFDPSSALSSAASLEFKAAVSKRFGFEPDPEMPRFPFHPESRNTLIAACTVAADGTVTAGFVPVYIDIDGRPVALGNDSEGQRVVGFIENLSNKAGFSNTFTWRQGRVIVEPKSTTQSKSAAQ